MGLLIFCSESNKHEQIQGVSSHISFYKPIEPSFVPLPTSHFAVAARILQLKSQMTKCLPRFMPHRSVITAAHAEVHIPVCDLSLDITPEGGGFHY